MQRKKRNHCCSDHEHHVSLSRIHDHLRKTAYSTQSNFQRNQKGVIELNSMIKEMNQLGEMLLFIKREDKRLEIKNRRPFD